MPQTFYEKFIQHFLPTCHVIKHSIMINSDVHIPWDLADENELSEVKVVKDPQANEKKHFLRPLSIQKHPVKPLELLPLFMQLDYNGIELEYFLPILDMSSKSHLLALPVGIWWLLLSTGGLLAAPQAPSFCQ